MASAKAPLPTLRAHSAWPNPELLHKEPARKQSPGHVAESDSSSPAGSPNSLPGPRVRQPSPFSTAGMLEAAIGSPLPPSGRTTNSTTLGRPATRDGSPQHSSPVLQIQSRRNQLTPISQRNNTGARPVVRATTPPIQFGRQMRPKEQGQEEVASATRGSPARTLPASLQSVLNGEAKTNARNKNASQAGRVSKLKDSSEAKYDRMLDAAKSKRRGRNVVEMDRLLKAFRTFDLDGNGTLDRWEMRRAMETMGMSNGDKRVDDIFAKMDRNGDGDISIEEWLDWMDDDFRMTIIEYVGIWERQIQIYTG